MSYDYSYDAGAAVATGVGAILGFAIFIYIIGLAIGIFTIVCNWKVYKKAGKNGWEAIIPIYNIVVLLEITGLPMWYLILLIVPIGNIVAAFLIYIELAKKFGQSAGFGVGLVFLNPIFMAILAFNKSYVYQGVTPGVPVGPTYNSQVIYNNGQQNYNQQMYSQPVQSQVNPQQVQSNNCSRCGAPINLGDKFCMHCGNQL